MIIRTVIIPLKDNDGNSLNVERMIIESEILGFFGGFTYHECAGKWRDPGDAKVYEDHSYEYTIACEDDSAFKHLLPKWCKLLKQQSLFSSRVHADVEFVSPK